MSTPAIRAIPESSALALLVARVDADHAHGTMPADDLALVTHAGHGRTHLHRGSSAALLVAVGDATTAQVVRRELDLDPVARGDADVVHAHLPGDVSENLVPVLQLDT